MSHPALKTEELFDSLQGLILSDQLTSGSLLPPERELAQRYQTNRNTLREAIRRLEQAGLVSVRRGSGVTVRDFRKTGTLDLVAPFLAHGKDFSEKARVILGILEPRLRMIDYGVERLVTGHTDDDLPALERAVDHARAAELRRAPQALMDAETEWYEALVDATHDQIVSWIARPVLQVNVHVLRRWPDLVMFEPSLCQYLEDLLKAVVARDLPRAQSLTRSHYQDVDTRVRTMLAPIVNASNTDLETK